VGVWATGRRSDGERATLRWEDASLFIETMLVALCIGWLSVAGVFRILSRAPKHQLSRASQGIHSMLVVRVELASSSPHGRCSENLTSTYVDHKLQNSIFANSSFSVASRFAHLSRAKLQIVPAIGHNVEGGTITVCVRPSDWSLPLAQKASNYEDEKTRDVELLRYSLTHGSPMLANTVRMLVGMDHFDRADRVLFFLPYGVMDCDCGGQAHIAGKVSADNGAIILLTLALLYSLPQYSWYNGFPSEKYKGIEVIMHELGHNIGFGHSIWDDGSVNVEYGDPTCLMGDVTSAVFFVR